MGRKVLTGFDDPEVAKHVGSLEAAHDEDLAVAGCHVVGRVAVSGEGRRVGDGHLGPGMGRGRGWGSGRSGKSSGGGRRGLGAAKLGRRKVFGRPRSLALGGHLGEGGSAVAASGTVELVLHGGSCGRRSGGSTGHVVARRRNSVGSRAWAGAIVAVAPESVDALLHVSRRVLEALLGLVGGRVVALLGLVGDVLESLLALVGGVLETLLGLTREVLESLLSLVGDILEALLSLTRDVLESLLGLSRRRVVALLSLV